MKDVCMWGLKVDKLSKHIYILFHVVLDATRLRRKKKKGGI